MTEDNHRPVTRAELREEIKAALKNYSTKDDLKAALKNYPTKDDLKAALKNYPTKDDLKAALKNHPTNEDHHRLALEIHRLRSDVDDIKQRMVTKEEWSRMMTAIDEVMATYRQQWSKLIVHDGILRDHEERIAGLEPRAQ